MSIGRLIKSSQPLSPAFHALALPARPPASSLIPPPPPGASWAFLGGPPSLPRGPNAPHPWSACGPLAGLAAAQVPPREKKETLEPWLATGASAPAVVFFTVQLAPAARRHRLRGRVALRREHLHAGILPALSFFLPASRRQRPSASRAGRRGGGSSNQARRHSTASTRLQSKAPCSAQHSTAHTSISAVSSRAEQSTAQQLVATRRRHPTHLQYGTYMHCQPIASPLSTDATSLPSMPVTLRVQIYLLPCQSFICATTPIRLFFSLSLSCALLSLFPGPGHRAAPQDHEVPRLGGSWLPRPCPSVPSPPFPRPHSPLFAGWSRTADGPFPLRPHPTAHRPPLPRLGLARSSKRVQGCFISVDLLGLARLTRAIPVGPPPGDRPTPPSSPDLACCPSARGPK